MRPFMRSLPLVGSVLILFVLVHAAPASAQFWKKTTQLAACGGLGLVGVKIGDKMAEFEAKKLRLSPEEARKHRLAFQVGMGLALCAGGAAIAGTAYEKLSKRGREAREKEVMAALEDAQPHAYVDPDNPSLRGNVVAQPATVEGNQECRIVQDQLAPDEALVKYCRPAGGGQWQIKTL